MKNEKISCGDFPSPRFCRLILLPVGSNTAPGGGTKSWVATCHREHIDMLFFKRLLTKKLTKISCLLNILGSPESP